MYSKKKNEKFIICKCDVTSYHNQMLCVLKNEEANEKRSGLAHSHAMKYTCTGSHGLTYLNRLYLNTDCINLGESAHISHLIWIFPQRCLAHTKIYERKSLFHWEVSCRRCCLRIKKKILFSMILQQAERNHPNTYSQWKFVKHAYSPLKWAESYLDISLDLS